MQKKNRTDQAPSSSAWQDTMKKQERSNQAKKYGVWGVIIAICLVAFGGMVYFVNKSSSSPVTAGQVATNVPPVSSKDHTFGNSKSKVVLIEYGDFECPTCGAYYPVVKKVTQNYKDKILFVARNFQINTTHLQSNLATQAAWAADQQGKYWEMHDLLFAGQVDWSGNDKAGDVFVGYAKKLGLDTDKFTKDMNSEDAKKYALAQTSNAMSAGITQTPTFILNGKFISPQDENDFNTLLDKELAASK